GDGRVREYPGDYSAYLEFREREEAARIAEERAAGVSHQPPSSAPNENAKLRKMSFKEKRELETLEAQIAAAESRQAEIEAQLNVHSSDAAQVQMLFTEQRHLLQRLGVDLERWAELAEKAE
ncbi:MAG: ABC transporter C-terminal domain-containing protein, partial [Acidobacteriota bacterium]|nr:ABC transporter C-terminal domain-containing protein [Acidobacteriota bacterium]